jgi:tyrosine-protein kinase Etk/Wzc
MKYDIAGMAKIQIPETWQETHDEEPGGIDVLDVLLILTQNVRFIAVFTFVALVAGAIYAFLLPPTFTALATILPPQQQQSSLTSLMGQLGPLAGLNSGGGGLLKNPADMYVGFLESRTIADDLIKRFQLERVYKSKNIEIARRLLKGQSEFEAAKDGLIHISVKDRDPNQASKLANGYVDALYQLNSSLAITEAAQRRVFFDEQLTAERNALASAENDLKKTEQETGVIQLTGQDEAIIRNIADVRAQIASRQVQMQSIRTFETDQNPDVTRIQEEIDTLLRQLASLESAQQKTFSGSTQMPAGQVPGISLEYARKVREVRYHETLFDLLSKQYEAAKIDEAKSAPIIQVVDRAVPPVMKSGPHRLLICIGFGLVAFILSSLWSFVRHSFQRIQSVPENASKLREMRSALHLLAKDRIRGGQAS